MHRSIRFLIISGAAAAISGSLFWFGQSRRPHPILLQPTPQVGELASQEDFVPAKRNPEYVRAQIEKFKQQLATAKTQQERDAATTELASIVLSILEETANSVGGQHDRIATLERSVSRLSERLLQPSPTADGTERPLPAPTSIPAVTVASPQTDHTDVLIKVGGFVAAIISVVFAGIGAWAGVQSVVIARDNRKNESQAEA